MRDFCVAASAAIPLLLLTIASEVRQLALKRLRVETRTEMAADRYAYSEYDIRRGRRGLRILLISGGAGLFIALFSIPFSPEGAPENPWHWTITVLVGLTIAVVFAYAAAVLLRSYAGMRFEIN